MEDGNRSQSGVAKVLRAVAGRLPPEVDLSLVNRLLDRGDYELAGEELKQHAAELGIGDAAVWTPLAEAFDSMEFEGDAEECRLLGSLLRGELTSPWVRLSDKARVVLESHEGDTIGHVTVLDDFGATFVHETWQQEMPLDPLVVVAEVANGDVWVIDPEDGESVGVLAHEVFWAGHTDTARGALVFLADDLASALRDEADSADDA